MLMINLLVPVWIFWYGRTNSDYYVDSVGQ